jgi:cytidylate kinase
VIRQYHQEKGRVRQINRVDWEPERSLSKEGLEPIDFDNLGMPRPDEISAILIHDLVKGVVTKDLIVVLKERYPKARWYVRSKLKTPRWLTLIRDSIELLVIGPEVAALHNPWETWLAYGQMTIQALEIIEKLPGKNVVLLSDQREVIARLSEQCVTAKSMIEPSPPAQLGWTSAFFASLAHSMCHKKADTMPEDISWAIESADELGGIPLPASCETPSVEKRQPNIRPGLWAKEANDWQQARQGCGIIKADNGEMTLEVWRGSSHLPGYIACIKRKEEIIIGIGQNLRAFNEGGSQIRSLSIMLQADPGAGKTVLAKSLADAFNFSFVRFDITQMIHRDELLDLFDTLATMQANEDKKILVFVDEINALLDNSHVYGAFLAPLEESVFARRGKSFSLKPCVWVFAGTKLDEAGVASREKLSDFKSRMTIIENIDFKSLALTTKDTERLQNEARLEQVYLGAAMIGRHFPDVQKVTKEILDHFHKLDPAEAPARAIRKLAGSLRNVQYGSVSRANCESWDIEWEDSKEGETPVKLYFG